MATPWLLGHRGSDWSTNKIPEHSVQSYSAAIDAGADFIELDLRTTKDGFIVAAHDTVYNSATGRDISKMTLAEAKAFRPSLMTLDEVIDFVQKKNVETGREVGIAFQPYGADGAAIADTFYKHHFTNPDKLIVEHFYTGPMNAFMDRAKQLNFGAYYMFLLAHGTSGVSDREYADILANLKRIDGIGVMGDGDIGDVVSLIRNTFHKDVSIWTDQNIDSTLASWISSYKPDSVFTNWAEHARTVTDKFDGLKVREGTSGNDSLIMGGSSSFKIFGQQGNDIIATGNGDDIIYGDGGNDKLNGGAGNDSLNGGEGNDFLKGGSGADLLRGAAGNDVLLADSSDTVHFIKGDGMDLVVSDGLSTIRLEGFRQGDVEWRYDGNDIVMVSKISDDAIIFQNARNWSNKSFAVTFKADTDSKSPVISVAFQDVLKDAADGGVKDSIQTAYTALKTDYAADLQQSFEPTKGNLIVNGSFEDTNPNAAKTWWGYKSWGTPGWTDRNNNYLEHHADTVNQVKPLDGRYYLDMDGGNRNMEISQTVKNVAEGKVYDISFSLAYTDPRDANDKIVVTWNGFDIYPSSNAHAPLTNKWQTITIRVVGGDGDGTNTLTFKHVSTPNWVGIALDNVTMTLAVDQDISAGTVRAPSPVTLSGTNGQMLPFHVDGYDDWLTAGSTVQLVKDNGHISTGDQLSVGNAVSLKAAHISDTAAVDDMHMVF